MSKITREALDNRTGSLGNFSSSIVRIEPIHLVVLVAATRRYFMFDLFRRVSRRIDLREKIHITRSRQKCHLLSHLRPIYDAVWIIHLRCHDQ